jgi:hypothetical protein
MKGDSSIQSKVHQSLQQITPKNSARSIGNNNKTLEDLPVVLKLSSTKNSSYSTTNKISSKMGELIPITEFKKYETIPKVYSRDLPELVPNNINNTKIGLPINRVPVLMNQSNIGCHVTAIKEELISIDPNPKNDKKPHQHENSDNEVNLMDSEIGNNINSRTDPAKIQSLKKPVKIEHLTESDKLETIVTQSQAHKAFSVIGNNISNNINTIILPDQSLFLGIHATMAQKTPSYKEDLMKKYLGNIQDLEKYIKDGSTQITPVNEITSIGDKIVHFKNSPNVDIRRVIYDNPNNKIYFIVGQ